MNDIASLHKVGSEFDTGAKFFRLLAKDGIGLSHLQKVIDDTVVRKNLVAYLCAGCPALGSTDADAAASDRPVFKSDAGIVQLSGGSHDPHEFYKDRKGLYVGPEVRQNVLSEAQAVERLEETMLTFYDMDRDAEDADVKAALPLDHVFDDASEFCACLAEMIALQLNGEEGDLETNGCQNLFYLKDYLVTVHWDAASRRWVLRGLKVGNGIRKSGRRAFSRS